jgi:hypothetical protein
VIPLGQKKVGMPVPSLHVKLQVSHQQLEAGKFNRFSEIILILVQPSINDGGDCSRGRWMGIRISNLALPFPALPQCNCGSWVPVNARLYGGDIDRDICLSRQCQAR